MNKKKICAALLAAILLIVPLSPSAFALSSLFSEDGPFGDLVGGLSDTIAELFGQNTPGGNAKLSDLFSNPGGVLDTIRERIGTAVDDQTLIEAISQLLGNAEQSFNLNDLTSNDFLNRLRKYLGMAEVTEESTTAAAPTTAPAPTTAYTPTTQATQPATVYYYYIPSTAAYTPPATTVYSGAQTYSVPDTTVSQETYSYVQPSMVTVPELTTQTTFNPVITEDPTEAPAKSGSTAKTVIGVVILVLSLAAVVVVAVILRKSKI